MQSQHISFLRARLESMDSRLEQYEIQLKMTGKSDNVLIKPIREIRKEINKFLSYLGAPTREKDIHNEIYTACMFFDVDLIEMEPTRFQKGYGKLDSKDEEKAIEDFLNILDKKNRDLKKACVSPP